MIEKIEKLMNSSCKEDILLAMHMVKHHTGIGIPTVIAWYIERRCNSPWKICFYKSEIHMFWGMHIIIINHSELD